MNDLTDQELNDLDDLVSHSSKKTFTQSQVDLKNRIKAELALRLELASLDLNDCAGGACKL